MGIMFSTTLYSFLMFFDSLNHSISLPSTSHVKNIADYCTFNDPVMYGCRSQWKGISPALRLAVEICADALGAIILVSKSLPLFGSSSVLPLVTVCGVVSLFCTCIVSPFFTERVSG